MLWLMPVSVEEVVMDALEQNELLASKTFELAASTMLWPVVSGSEPTGHSMLQAPK